jgi:dihydrofolate reductase
MGSRTYETALRFEAQGLGWSYGDKPTFVLTSRELPRIRDCVEFYSGDLAQFVNGHLRPTFRTIWFVGGGAVAAECLRLGLADEVRYSIVPILIGDGVPFFEKLDRDIALHLAEVKAYKSGMVELCYELRGHRGESGNATEQRPGPEPFTPALFLREELRRVIAIPGLLSASSPPTRVARQFGLRATGLALSNSSLRE